MPELRSIQALRGIAALGVVVFHLAQGKAVLGAAGVDLFFVISGFIMGAVGVRDKPGSFIVKRIVRIVPLYWLVTLLMFAGSFVTGVFSNLTFSAPDLLFSLFFIPYVGASGNSWPIVVPGWTLNYEMFFYALFAFGLLISRPIGFAVHTIGALALVGLLADFQIAPLAFWTNQIVVEFAFGLLLARFLGPRPPWIGASLAILGIGALAAWGLGSDTPAFRVLFWGAPAAAIVAGAVILERSGYWPSRIFRPLQHLGDASYSLYLTHGLVIALVGRMLVVPAVFAPIAFAAAIVVALLCYRLFERPVGAVLHNFLLATPKSAPTRRLASAGES